MFSGNPQLNPAERQFELHPTDAKAHLQQLGIKHLAVDAYFAKCTFVDQITQNSNLLIITRLRDDAVLRYRYVGPSKKGKGRPKAFDGKVNVKQPKEEHFKLCRREPGWNLYEGVVHCKAFKRWIKVALWHEIKADGTVGKVKIYASTDLDLPATQLYLYYKSRFQIEFLYRDAKGHTGLEHSQSRNEDRMDFHFNLALTAVSVAKAACWYPNIKNEHLPFSIEDIKAQFFNELVIDRFFCAFGKTQTRLKIIPLFSNLEILASKPLLRCFFFHGLLFTLVTQLNVVVFPFFVTRAIKKLTLTSVAELFNGRSLQNSSSIFSFSKGW
ncbi:transposase [bacterium]|nr:transposase [bacterium]